MAWLEYNLFFPRNFWPYVYDILLEFDRMNDEVIFLLIWALEAFHGLHKHGISFQLVYLSLGCLLVVGYLI